MIGNGILMNHGLSLVFKTKFLLSSGPNLKTPED